MNILITLQQRRITRRARARVNGRRRRIVQSAGRHRRLTAKLTRRRQLFFSYRGTRPVHDGRRRFPIRPPRAAVTTAAQQHVVNEKPPSEFTTAATKLYLTRVYTHTYTYTQKHARERVHARAYIHTHVRFHNRSTVAVIIIITTFGVIRRVYDYCRGDGG